MKRFLLSLLMLSSLSLMSNEVKPGDDKISVENLTEKEFSAYLDGKKSGDEEMEFRNCKGICSRSVVTKQFEDAREKFYWLLGYHCRLEKETEDCKMIEKVIMQCVLASAKLQPTEQSEES